MGFMDSVVTDLLDFAQKFAKQASDVLIAFAAIGTLTMAIIQTIKELTPVRSWFNRRKVMEWLNREMPPPPSPESIAAATASREALVDLLVLATAADEGAFFDLELERLAGQISAAAGIVVDYPEFHVPLLWRLARRARPEDVKQLLEVPSGGRSLAALRETEPDEYEKFLAAKSRVTHQIQRNIDGFQISTAFAWKTGLQYASFAISFALTGVALALSTAPLGFWVTLLIGLASGFFAPIARDLVGILAKAKRT